MGKAFLVVLAAGQVHSGRPPRSPSALPGISGLAPPAKIPHPHPQDRPTGRGPGNGRFQQELKPSRTVRADPLAANPAVGLSSPEKFGQLAFAANLQAARPCTLPKVR